MASRSRQIIEKIKTIIAVDYTGDESGLDMQNKVVIGSIIDPPYLPFASINFTQAQSQFGKSLGRYQITNTYEVYAFVGGGALDERIFNSMDLVEDMTKKLVADRQLQLSSLVDDIKCQFIASDGDRFGIQGIGIGYIQIQVFSQSDTGI